MTMKIRQSSIAGLSMLLLGCFVGCKDAAKRVNPADAVDGSDANAQSHMVMIIDDGFDLQHPAYKDKIVASYTIDCDISGGIINVSMGTTPKDLVSMITTDDKSCIVRDGIKLTKSPRF